MISLFKICTFKCLQNCFGFPLLMNTAKATSYFLDLNMANVKGKYRLPILDIKEVSINKKMPSVKKMYFLQSTCDKNKNFYSSHFISPYAQERLAIVIRRFPEHYRSHMERLNEHSLCCHFQADKFWPNLRFWKNMSYWSGDINIIYHSSCFGI